MGSIPNLQILFHTHPSRALVTKGLSFISLKPYSLCPLNHTITSTSECPETVCDAVLSSRDSIWGWT